VAWLIVLGDDLGIRGMDMRYLVAAFGLLLLTACATTDNTSSTSRPASAERPTACLAGPTPDVQVGLEVVTPPADRSLGFRALTTAMAAKTTRTMPVHYYIFVGIDAVLDGMAQLNASASSLASGKACLWLTTANTTIRWRNNVRLAAEVAAGSCPDKVMQAFAAKVLADQRPRDAMLKQRVKDAILAAAQIGVVDETTDGAKQRLMRLVQDAVTKQLQAEAATYNTEMDKLTLDFETAQSQSDCGRHAWQQLIAG